MGNFYVNFTLLADPHTAAAALRKDHRIAAILPFPPHIVVLEEDSDAQDISAIKKVATLLSSACNAPVLAVLNHDDDILKYWLFQGPSLLDQYDSCPGYFEDQDLPPSGGNAKILCAVFHAPAAEKDVQSLLHGPRETFAFITHSHLLTALHLPQAAAGTSYASIKEGELPENLSPSEILTTP